MEEVLNYEHFTYIRRLPEGFEAGKRYPVVLFLHGAGSRGRNIEILKNNPFFRTAAQWMDAYHMVAVAPQCYADSWFDIFEQLRAFASFVTQQSFSDPERIAVMGASMGGYGTWQLAMSDPQLFAAIVPICGGGMYWNAGRLAHMGIWAFHGDQDPVVYPEESKKMVEAVNNCGGTARFTMCQGVAHDSWNQAYASEEMFRWLTAQKRYNAGSPDMTLAGSEQFG